MYDPACLNQSNLPELMRHMHVLNPIVQTRLDAVDYRLKTMPERFDRQGQHYRDYAGIIAMSDINQGHRLCHCFIRNQPCGIWKLCPYCAWRRKMELHKKFLPRFHQHRWYAMTIAFTGYLVLCPAGDDIALYWKASVYAVKRMVEEGYFNGAVWSEEIHVASFGTQNAQPHLHVVVLAHAVTMNEIERLKGYVREYQGQTWDIQEAQFVDDEFATVALEPSTCTRSVESRYHLANTLAYLTKPINLWEPYQRDFAQMVSGGRANVAFLNQNVSEALLGFHLQARHRRQLDYKGHLDARSRARFIGVPRLERERPSHYRRICEMLEDDQLGMGRLAEPEPPENFGLSIEQQHGQ